MHMLARDNDQQDKTIEKQVVEYTEQGDKED
jgi:hypothetical protein